MLWAGEKTGSFDSAHIDFLSTINNPIGVKIGPNFNIDHLAFLYDK